ncbi:MAG TPA: hypothetical protein VFW33_23165, partial [Gemmataceae bacterium]|nr:hypothetical protein [Gemmataceae bacterium]
MLTLHGHAGPVWALAYSPDGTLLASGGHDRTIRLWGMRECRELVALRGHLNTITALAFSPDGSTLASVGNDRTIRLWDVPTGLSHPLGPRQRWSLASVAFFPDGRSVTTAGGAITSVAVGPDGLVAAGSGYPRFPGRGTLTVWDVESRRATALLEMTDMGHWRGHGPPQEPSVHLGGSIRVIKTWKPG